MKIETISINEVRKYSNNAKLHPQEQIEQIKRSIQEFGNNDPIAVDENNIIIEGHGRFEALTQLGYEEVEVIRLSHLTDEQKKAYILAHNQLTLNSSYDEILLQEELENIELIDMSQFGFDLEVSGLDFGAGEKSSVIEEEEDEESYPEHFLRTLNLYNLQYYDETRVTGKWNMPIVEPVDYIPKALRAFPDVLNKPSKEYGVHFHVDDYRFEQVWRRPDFYIEKLSEFDCVLSPDFSVYTDMPLAMQLWNLYRMRMFDQMCQNAGLTVIPQVTWGEEVTWEFCFDGLPKNSTLEVRTVGVHRDQELMESVKKGLAEVMRRLTPKRLIIFGTEMDFGVDFGDCEVLFYSDDTRERIFAWSREKRATG